MPAVLDQHQLELIFTPPSKVIRQNNGSTVSPSRLQISNDENLSVVDLQYKQNQQHALAQYQKQVNMPLQPSILENSQIQNRDMSNQLKNYQHLIQGQIFNNKQHIFEELQQQLQGRLALDESHEYGQHQPRDLIPRPYEDQPESPANEENRQNDQVVMFQNQSFSDQDFIQECQFQELQQRQEMAFREGEQFSFRLNQMKKSELSSNYSTLQDGTQASSQKNNRQSPSSAGSRNYQEQLKFQHSSRNAQIKNHEEVQKQSRTLNNFRGQQQQQQNQHALSRSISSNCIKPTTQQAKSRSRNPQLNITSSTKNLSQQSLQKSFVQTSRNLQGEDQNKTPRGQTQRGLLTARNADIDDGRRSSFLKSLPIEVRRTLDLKKQQFLSSFQQMNIMHLIELERIKKPSQLAYITARLVCQFFALFKDSTNFKLHMEDLIEWSDIQRHINTQIIKYTNELLSTIKNKILFNDGMSQQAKDSLVLRLINLRQEYFTGDNLKLFKHLSTNKTLQTIINFIYNVMSYYLETQLSERSCQSQDGSTQDHDSNQIDVFNQTDASRSFLLDKQNYDALTNTQELSQRAPSLEMSSARRKPRPNVFAKNDSTPTAVAQQPTLQKSGSRCLLQRRDRSQIISQKDSNYTSNKSPMMKNESHHFGKKTAESTEQNSVKRVPMTARCKSKSPLNSRTVKQADHSTNEVQQKQPMISPQVFSIENNQDLETEAPLDLNYKLMVESSGFADMIKKTAAAIELNMKQSPKKKEIDMSLIEQIKQRRKDQLRDASEDRLIGERRTQL